MAALDAGHQDVFFRVLDATPSRARTLRLPPVERSRLAATDIAITLHERSYVDAADSDLVVSITPRRPPGANNAVALLTDLGSRDVVVPSLRRWRTAPDLQYAVAGYETDADVCNLLTAMVGARAFPGVGSPYVLSNAEAANRAAMQRLSATGCVSQVGEAWVFTTSGVRALQCRQRLCLPEQVFAVRAGVPIEDRTHFELRCALLEEGWREEVRSMRKIKDRLCVAKAHARAKTKY